MGLLLRVLGFATLGCMGLLLRVYGMLLRVIGLLLRVYGFAI